MITHTDIISSLTLALETGWFGSFAEGDGDSYHVELDGDGQVDVDSDSEEAGAVAEDFAASWRSARAFGMDALSAMRAGELDSAHRYTSAAASAERRWGDDPVWGEPLKMIDTYLNS